ncbi:hypothetical protein GLOTRDRAFT_129241 [Gloeophyllum trabeum ATCC 11539]|uniref:DUF6534 domain-containing protein n=1 Tax=Gloeophyllum trabeum (strain ATCC 11539 / FP-39264 / Madison 617) TaxID=670483 RepID=S7Q9M2_GLOTA|nr:uncharacterized protein GLOTRDRAFT_129241 [Gloeophyllum trabeum ATCC 11539]EPQ56038.1 hypothetical protein GLOTRDRAFT_129241 [Gloeophyllum trabeum ATCC 11539]
MLLTEVLNATYGALFIGLLCAAVLFGVTNLQIFVYFKTYSEDWIVYKVAAAGLWCLDALHLCLAAHAVYFYLVIHFGVFDLDVVWSFKLQMALNIITILAVQSLYVFRLWKLNGSFRRKFLLSFVTVSVVLGYGVGIAAFYFLYTIHTFFQAEKMGWLIYMTFGTSTVVDATIAGAFCWILWTHRTGNPKSNSIIYSIILYVIGSGALTSMCSITCLATFGAMPGTFSSWGINFLLNKLYVNSFLAVLNARQSLKDRRLDDDPICVAAYEHGNAALQLDKEFGRATNSSVKQEMNKLSSPTHHTRSIEIMIQQEAFTRVG